jgi:hypothetical protein
MNADGWELSGGVAHSIEGHDNERDQLHMRYMIAILLLVVLVIIDQTQFHGYYGSQLSLMAQRAISYVTR